VRMLNGDPIQVRHTYDGVLDALHQDSRRPKLFQWLTVPQGREECASGCDPTSCRWMWLCGYGVVAFHSLHLPNLRCRDTRPDRIIHPGYRKYGYNCLRESDEGCVFLRAYTREFRWRSGELIIHATWRSPGRTNRLIDAATVQA